MNENGTVEPVERASDTFAGFAEIAEAVGATSKRLEKAARLAAYFSGLDDADLQCAARYLSGYAFPLRDARTTNVGGAALFGAILAVTGVEDQWLRESNVRTGDLGDSAAEAFLQSDRAISTAPLLLSALEGRLDELSSSGASARKRDILVSMLAGMDAREAKYLVKLIGGDLRIGLQEGAVEDAIARWSGAPLGDVQWANMLTGDIGETALLARSGRLRDAAMRLFHPIKSMLATPAASADEIARLIPDGFQVEDKFDGIRAQVHVARDSPELAAAHGVPYDGRRVAIFSRTLDEITESFPDIVPSLAALLPPDSEMEDGLIFDGEIVPIQGDRILPFLELQQRLGRKAVTEELRARIPAAYMMFDCLYAGRRLLLAEPWTIRRSALESLHPDGIFARRAKSTRFEDVEGLDAEFDAARARGNEGLMVKDPQSTYKPGRRGREWLKIKRAMATLDVVVTAAELGNGKRHSVLSDYTFAVRASESDPTLLNVGKAYSGLTDAEILELTVWFRAHTLQEFAHGKVLTVEPLIVLEVTFDNVQVSKRHKSGYALRFPRIVRIRTDKSSDEIDTLETVRNLANAQGTQETELVPPDPDGATSTALREQSS